MKLLVTGIDIRATVTIQATVEADDGELRRLIESATGHAPLDVEIRPQVPPPGSDELTPAELRIWEEGPEAWAAYLAARGPILGPR